MFQALGRRRFLPAEPEQGRHAGLRGRCSTGVGWWGVGVWIVLALGTGGCAKARAETVPDGPPLQMPVPPQRVLAPVEELAVPAVAVEPEAPPVVAVPPREPARPVTEARPRPAPPTAPPPTPPATGPRDLRAASPTNAPTEPGVREMLAGAASDIAAVNYNRLSAEGRSQYAQSVRFSAQAEQALAGRNLIFAATLAEKAATLAAELLGR
jgi:hypothetical protein